MPKELWGKFKNYGGFCNTEYDRGCTILSLLIFDVTISDDDSTMQYVLKHPSTGTWGQVLKTSKVKLHGEIPEMYFLADFSHRVKIVDKHIFSRVNESKSKWCGRNKSYSTRLKKYWVFAIKKKSGERIEELIQASKVPLEHMFKIMKVLVHSGASRQEHQNNK